MKKKEKLDVIKFRTVNDYIKSESKEFQSSKEAGESVQEIMNELLKELIKKSINNTKFRNANRIVSKDVLKAYEEMKYK